MDTRISGFGGDPLDLNDNDLIVQATPETRDGVLRQVSELVRSGRQRDATGQLWHGLGITSGTAASASLYTGLAVAINDRGDGTRLFEQFDGWPVDTSSILVKYTWAGDLNLDGYVDDKDLNAFNPAGSGWTSGDANYDGRVNGEDYGSWIQPTYDIIRRPFEPQTP